MQIDYDPIIDTLFIEKHPGADERVTTQELLSGVFLDCFYDDYTFAGLRILNFCNREKDLGRKILQALQQRINATAQVGRPWESEFVQLQRRLYREVQDVLENSKITCKLQQLQLRHGCSPSLFTSNG